MDLGDLTRVQEGLVSRRQVPAAGLDDVHIARMLRRREWARVYDGVYVDHTGPLPWLQRAWAAVLVHEPCALAGRSALRAFGVVVEPADRRIEPAAVQVASRASSEDAAVAPLADLCQQRRRLLSLVLEDVASGAHSALGRRSLGRVERARTGC